MAVAALVLAASTSAARAQEQMLFPAIHNAHTPIIQKINSEQVRIDVAVWLFIDREISLAIVNRFKAGVPVRVIGDAAAIFHYADENTRREFEFLASHGVPIRLRYHPTWFPEIMHWKCGIFVGQGVVEFGSANWTGFELFPWSPTNFKDETVMFTDDPAIFRGFLTKFEDMWSDTTYFLDWPEAYQLKTGSTWPTPMNINRARLEGIYPSPPGMVWSQGGELNNAMAAEIDREQSQVDMVIYRLSDPVITDALIRRLQAGVPVRIMVEPDQYRMKAFPEYELTGAQVDRLWLAGAQIRQRTHVGLTHMKTLITSHIAMNASSNFTRFWQRDHNYFIPAQGKPSLYLALKDRFQAMWQDTTNYGSFRPLPPEAPVLAGPANGATGVSTTPTLQWNRAAWAVGFDVYVGLSPTALVHQGRVSAQVTETPPAQYGWTLPQPLSGSTTYYWRVVARTFASDLNPGLVTASPVRSFTTAPGPTAAPLPNSCPGTAPGENWVCVNGGWVPLGGDTGGTVAPAPSAPSPAPAPAPVSTSCSTPQPVAGWVCVGDGWVPPDHPLALQASAQPQPSVSSPAPSGPATPVVTSCTTPQPVAGWVCINGGWVPPDHALALSAAPAPSIVSPSSSSSASCTTPSPGVGWICLNGGWLPPGHPLAIVR